MSTRTDQPGFPSVRRGVRSDRLRAAWIACAAVGLGLAVGVGTSFGQTWLGGAANAFVNSASAWLVVPFAVGALARRPAPAALAGLACCLLQLVGYELASELRFHATSWSFELGWAAAGVVAGPLFGWGGHLWRHGRAPMAGVGPALLAAAFVCEGVWTYLHLLHRPVTAALWIAIGVAIAGVGLRGRLGWRWLVLAVPAGFLAELAIGRLYG